MVIFEKALGSFSISLSFASGSLSLNLADTAIGLSGSIAISEAQLLAAGLKLVPAGVPAEIAGAAVSVVESATAAL